MVRKLFHTRRKIGFRFASCSRGSFVHVAVSVHSRKVRLIRSTRARLIILSAILIRKDVIIHSILLVKAKRGTKRVEKEQVRVAVVASRTARENKVEKVDMEVGMKMGAIKSTAQHGMNLAQEQACNGASAAGAAMGR